MSNLVPRIIYMSPELSKHIPLDVDLILRSHQHNKNWIDGDIEICHKPTWTWCENPTDEMAKLRPRCEVRDLIGDRDSANQTWKPGRLFGVMNDQYSFRFIIRGDIGCDTFRYCRVRLSASGEVLVDWEGEE